MKKLPLVAMLPLLSLLQPAAAETSAAALEKRCSEQERQIRQLEEENGRLRSLLDTASKMAPSEKASETTADVVAAPPKAVYYTVSQGDTLSRIARRNGTTSEVIAELNKLKDAGLIRPGQKLKLPETKPPAPPATASKNISTIRVEETTEKAESTPAHRGGNHIVKDGETFFGIARKYGLRVETLAEVNPQVNPRSIRIGQSLKLVPRKTEKSLAKSESAPVPESPPALSSAPTPRSEPVSNQPLIRSIRIDEEVTFGDFAASHGMKPAKLNALNGLHLESNTVLAKGSELYVSAQP